MYVFCCLTNLFLSLHSDKLPFGSEVFLQVVQGYDLILFEAMLLLVSKGPLYEVYGVLHVVWTQGRRAGAAAGDPGRLPGPVVWTLEVKFLYSSLIIEGIGRVSNQ